MKHFALYLSGPLIVALLVPFAFGSGAIKLYPLLLVGAVPVVLAFSLAIAAPLFVLATRKFELKVRASLFMALAFVAGFISFVAFSCLSVPVFSSAGDSVFVQGGHFTIAGWDQLLAQSAIVGLLSIPGGIMWWLAARTPLERSLHGA